MLSSLHIRTKLALFLVPALAATIFLMWWYHPERVITRRFDSLLALVDVGLMRTDSTEQLEGALGTLVSDPLDVLGPDPVPTGPISVSEMAESLQRLHNSVRNCTVQRSDLGFHFPHSGEARVETRLQADLSAGSGYRRVFRYHAEILYKKGPGGWKLERIALTSI